MPVALTAAVVGAAVASAATGAVIAGITISALGASVLGALASFAINAAFAKKPSAPQLATESLSDRSQTLTGLGSARSREIVYGEVIKGGTVIFRHTTDTRGSALATENHIVPAIAPYTITISRPDDITTDAGVRVQTLDGNPDGAFFYRYADMSATSGTPSEGQYSRTFAEYTFNSADAGKPVEISYNYRVTSVAHETLHLVVVFAGHEVHAIDGIYFNNEEVTLDGNGDATGKYANHVFISKHLGGPDQEADWHLMSAAPDKWTSAHRGRGVAYIYLRLRKNPDLFPNGVPNITAAIRGKKVYDPVTNTTAWSANAALCIADYLHDPVYGLGAEYGSEIDNDVLTTSRLICTEGVALANGNLESRYLCNGVVDTSRTPLENIEKMLTSLSGRVVYSGGKFRVLAGAYLPPTVTLTEDDMRGPVNVKPRLSRDEVFNGVKGVYISPDNYWQPSDFPPVTNATYLAEDGGERVWFEMDLPFTTSPTMAQRIAKIELEKVRQQITAAVQFKLKAYQVEPPDTVQLTNAVMGWDGKAFEVVECALAVEGGDSADGDAPVLVVNQMLRETHPSVYDWNSGEETQSDPAPDTNLPNPFIVLPPGKPVIVESLYETMGSAGVRAKAAITWAASPDGQARRYDFQWKDRTAAAWNSHPGLLERSDEILDIAPGNYLFRVRAINGLGVSSLWSQTEQEILGLYAPPADLTGFAVQASNGLAKFTWDLHPDLDVRIGGRIYVRWSPLLDGATWNDGTLINPDGFAGDTTLGFGPLQTGTYMAKAVDSTGHPSVNAIAFIATEAVVTGFTTIAILTLHPTFAGTRTDTVVVDNALQLDAVGSWDETPGNIDDWPSIDFMNGVAPAGSCLFSNRIDLATPQTVRVVSRIESTAFDTGDSWDARANLIDDWGLIDGSIIEDAEVRLMVRITDDDPNGVAPSWGEWHDLGMVADYTARGFEFRMDFTSGDSAHNRKVTALEIRAKVAAAGGGSGGNLLIGSGAPAADVGTDGSVWINTAEPAFYQKDSGVWGGRIPFPEGPQGPPGPEGPQGSGTDAIWINGRTIVQDVNNGFGLLGTTLADAFADHGYVGLEPWNYSDANNPSTGVFGKSYAADAPILVPRFGGLKGKNTAIGVTGPWADNPAQWTALLGTDSGGSGFQTYFRQYIEGGFQLFGPGNNAYKIIGHTTATIHGSTGLYTEGHAAQRHSGINCTNFTVGHHFFAPQYSVYTDMKAGLCGVSFLHSGGGPSQGGMVDSLDISYLNGWEHKVGHLFMKTAGTPTAEYNVRNTWCKGAGNNDTTPRCSFAFVNSPHDVGLGIVEQVDWNEVSIQQGTSEYNSAGCWGLSQNTVSVIVPEVLDADTVITSTVTVPSVEVYIDSWWRVKFDAYTFQSNQHGIVIAMEDNSVLEWARLNLPGQCGTGVRALGPNAYVDFVGPLIHAAGVVENVRAWPLGQTINVHSNWASNYIGFGGMERISGASDFMGAFDLNDTAFPNTFTPQIASAASTAGISGGTGSDPAGVLGTVSYTDFSSSAPNAVAKTSFISGGASAKSFGGAAYALTQLMLYNPTGSPLHLVIYLEDPGGNFIRGCNPEYIGSDPSIAGNVPEYVTLWPGVWQRFCMSHSIGVDTRLCIRRFNQTTSNVRLWHTMLSFCRPTQQQRAIYNRALNRGLYPARP